MAYFVDGKPVHGRNEFNAANRDAFAAQPHKYAPQYGGYCAFGVSRGYKADKVLR